MSWIMEHPNLYAAIFMVGIVGFLMVAGRMVNKPPPEGQDNSVWKERFRDGV